MYPARDAAGALGLARAELGAGPRRFTSTAFATFTAFVNGLRDSGASPDGTKLPFATGFDPATGISDQYVYDTTTATIATIQPQQRSLLCNYNFLLSSVPTSETLNPFTADSRWFLSAYEVDPDTLLRTMAAIDARGVRRFSDARGFACAPTTGARVVFNDHTDAALTAADLRIIDLAAPGAATLIRAQAHPSFVVSRDGRRVVLASGPGDPAAQQGLYVYAVPR